MRVLLVLLAPHRNPLDRVSELHVGVVSMARLAHLSEQRAWRVAETDEFVSRRKPDCGNEEEGKGH